MPSFIIHSLAINEFSFVSAMTLTFEERFFSYHKTVLREQVDCEAIKSNKIYPCRRCTYLYRIFKKIFCVPDLASILCFSSNPRSGRTPACFSAEPVCDFCSMQPVIGCRWSWSPAALANRSKRVGLVRSSER